MDFHRAFDEDAEGRNGCCHDGDCDLCCCQDHEAYDCVCGLSGEILGFGRKKGEGHLLASGALIADKVVALAIEVTPALMSYQVSQQPVLDEKKT